VAAAAARRTGRRAQKGGGRRLRRGGRAGTCGRGHARAARSAPGPRRRRGGGGRARTGARGAGILIIALPCKRAPVAGAARPPPGEAEPGRALIPGAALQQLMEPYLQERDELRAEISRLQEARLEDAQELG